MKKKTQWVQKQMVSCTSPYGTAGALILKNETANKLNIV